MIFITKISLPPVHSYHILYLSYRNKNLAIANRSRVSYAHNSSRASIGLITHDLEI